MLCERLHLIIQTIGSGVIDDDIDEFLVTVPVL